MYTLTIADTISDIILNIGEALQSFFSWIISLLPDDPYNLSEVLTIPQAVTDVLAFVNWLVPIGRCLQLIITWITLSLLFWFVRALLKVFQLI